MKKFKLTTTLLRNSVIVTLVFVLGLVIGSKYGQNGQLPFAKNSQGRIQFNLVNVKTPDEISSKDVDFGQFWEVWQILSQDYLDPNKLDQTEMVEGAISGMTAALDDPYTMYLPPEEDKRAAESLAGSFYGVGIELGYIDEVVSVVAPLKGMPAEKAGVKAGDMILHVKDEKAGVDEDTQGWSLQEAVEHIRGERGTKVTLTLYRPDEKQEPFDIDVARDEIVIPSVELSFAEHSGKRAAVISLSRFGDRTDQEWDDIVDQILRERNGIDGILLDMRNNPGGYFDGAIDVASDFIDNKVVVSQQGKFTKEDFKSRGEARLKNIPVVVLVNRGSASASEIVAGAMRDDLGVKLIGEKTFGKGTVQDRRSLSNGGGLHVTIAKWILPDGGWIHEEGLPVDVEVTDNVDTEQDEVVEKGIESLGAALTQR